MEKRRAIILGILVLVALLFTIGCDTGGSNDDGDPSTNPVEEDYTIGDTGPAGGLIFYVDTADEHSWTYLEVAPVSTEWTGILWGNYGNEVGDDAQLSDIGDGQAATATIVAHMESESLTETAAQLCDALIFGGYDDWFLPSIDELDAIWDNLVDDGTGENSGVGGFADSEYWSSSENNSYNAWYKYFYDGTRHLSYKHYATQIRAIRAF